MKILEPSQFSIVIVVVVTVVAGDSFFVPEPRASVAPVSPTFDRDVAPIIFRHCIACHHPDAAAPFSLLTYESVRSRAKLIADVTNRRYMPPWKPEPGYGEFVGARRLPDDDIDTIQRWVAAGSPEGRVSDLPSAPRWTKGWQLGTPDLVIRMPEAFELGPEGPDVLRNFVIPIPVQSARYVKAVEFHPGTTHVVHHATMRIDKTSASRRLDEEDPAPGYDGLFAPSAEYPDGYFLGWTPGQALPPTSRDLAWHLNPGSDLVVQLHLMRTGRLEHVQVTIGLFFTPVAPQRTLPMLRLGRQDIDILPAQKKYVISDSYRLPVDAEIYAVQPHAHYRAKEIKGYATLPDGTTQWLIYIRDWDFNWQEQYYYRKPLPLPKGTTLSMQYTYDNSAENSRNPQLPPRRVRWGPNSTDEMGDLLIQLAPRSRADLALLERELDWKHRHDDIAGYETMLSVTPDRVSLHDGVGLLYMDEGNLASAIAHFQESVRLAPTSAARHFNLGWALSVGGRSDEAVTEYEKTLRINPNYVNAHNNLGSVMAAQGRSAEAMAHYRHALEIDPTSAEAHNNLGSVLLYLGRTDQAFDHLRRALELRSAFPDAHYNMARLLRAQGRPKEASLQFGEALRLRPDWPAVLSDYAWMLATHSDERVRDPQRAIRLAERAVELTNQRQPAPLDVLAAAYAAGGRFDQAVTTARAALGLLANADSTGAALGIRRRLALYEQRRSYIEDLTPVPAVGPVR